VRRQLAQAAAWTNDTELLAKLVEVVSVLAAEQRIRKPIDIPRPEWLRRGNARDGFAHAANVMKANAGRVRRVGA
jgi:hypothetical protein